MVPEESEGGRVTVLCRASNPYSDNPPTGGVWILVVVEVYVSGSRSNQTRHGGGVPRPSTS